MEIGSRYANHRFGSQFKLKKLTEGPLVQAAVTVILSLFTVSFFGIFAIKPTLSTIAGLMREIKDKKIVSQQLDAKVEALSLGQTSYEKIKPYLERIENAVPAEALFLRLISEIKLLALEDQVALETASFDNFYLVNQGGDLVSPQEAVPVDKKQEAKPEEAKAKTQESKPNELVFSLSLSGDYKNLKKFVADLTKIDRLVLVEKSQFKTEPSQEKDEKNQKLVLSLNLKSYYLKNEQ